MARFLGVPLLLVLLQVTASVRAQDTKKVRMCYFTNWSQYRPGAGHFTPANIDPLVCTHILYAFVGIDKENDTVKPTDLNDAAFYGQILSLKNQNRDLKVLVAVGGATERTTGFDAVSSDTERTRVFVDNVIAFLRQNGFDGLDVDWEFPTSRTRSNYQRFVQMLSEGFEREAGESGEDKLVLTIAVSGDPDSVEIIYGPSQLVQYVDYVLLMAYDLWGTWSNTLGHHSPLYTVIPGDLEQGRFSMDLLVSAWTQQGTPVSKLVLGFATYGRTGKLTFGSRHRPGDTWAQTEGSAGPVTSFSGYLAYFEICENLRDQQWSSAYSSAGEVPYAWNSNALQYICYDDPSSFEAKARYVQNNSLAGAMFWSLDLDDFSGQACGHGTYPLLQQVRQVFEGITEEDDPIRTSIITITSTTTAHTTTTTTTTEEQSAASANAPVTTTTTTTTTTISPTSVITIPVEGCSFTCKDDFGYHGDPADCSQFYVCSHGVAHRFKCPAGLRFDSRASTCNWPIMVRCEVVC